MRRRMGVLGAIAVGCALLLPGCTLDDALSQRPQSLTMAFTEPDTASDPLAAWFARSVFEVSHGRLAIRLALTCCGDSVDAESDLVKGVAHRRYDLGWVPTRAFGRLGVTSVQALTAPMLIDSYTLEQAVVDSDLPARMLGGLSWAGVTGLAIEPGYLRRPISTRAAGPLRHLDDWKGIVFSSIGSGVPAAAIAAFGAASVQLSPPERDTAFGDGALDGYENSIVFQFRATNLMHPFITENVSLWPRVSALIGNPGVLATLSSTQRRWIEEAAQDARRRVSDLRTIEAKALRDSCSAGTTFVTAPPADVAAMRVALAPVYRRLSADAFTRRSMAAIHALDVQSASDRDLAPRRCP